MLHERDRTILNKILREIKDIENDTANFDLKKFLEKTVDKHCVYC